MPYCEQCGSRHEDAASFCGQCGRPLAAVMPPAGRPRARFRFRFWLAAGLLLAGAALTLWRLSPYLAIGPAAERKAGPAAGAPADTGPGEPGRLPADPVEAVQRIQQGAEQVVGAVLGDGRRKHQPALPSAPTLDGGMSEVERSAAYQYDSADCTRLFSDVLQQAGLAIGHQVAAATAVSAGKEDELGKKLAGELARELGDRLDPPAEAARLAYLRRLGAALVAGVERRDIRYSFHVVADDRFNAFAIPGGNIYVHTGLLDAVDNEAQLAGVLAHEIVHVDQRHCVAMYQVLAALPGAAANPAAFIALRMAGHPFQGRAEAEADELGLRLAYGLGYSPFQIVRLWEERGGRNGAAKAAAAPPSMADGPAAMLGALAGVLAGEAANVLNDHPHEGKRACLLRNATLALLKEAPRDLVYVGARNLRDRIPMNEQRF